MHEGANRGAALFALRATLSLFFLGWTLEKFIKPEATIAIGEMFYGVEIGPVLAMGVGVVQAVMLVLFAFGLYRTLSYGFFLATHTVSVLVTVPMMLDPFSGYNHLLFAGIPVWGALFALFLMRDEDRLFAFEPRRVGRPARDAA